MPLDFAEYRRKLLDGDFSDLASYADQVEEWLQTGVFDDDEAALGEALTCAAFNGQTKLVEVLLDHGAGPDGGSLTGMTALHWAANRGYPDTLNVLLAAGGDIEARNNYGGTVLGCTVWSAVHEPKPGQVEAARILVLAGADVTQTDYPTGIAELDAILEP